MGFFETEESLFCLLKDNKIQVFKPWTFESFNEIQTKNKVNKLLELDDKKYLVAF
jgi:hypothetical protein